MDAVEFLKKWRDMCDKVPDCKCSAECPMHYDYCPAQFIIGDRDETLESIVEYVEKAKA